MSTERLLSDRERQILIEELKVSCLCHMFDDNQEEEYVMSGFPEFKGLLNMTDDELLLEYGHWLHEDNTPEKRAARLRLEWKEDGDG